MATTSKRKSVKAVSKAPARKTVAKQPPELKPVRKKASRPAAPSRARLAAKSAAVPASGPLTLDEARALAYAKRPQMAARKLAPPAATPGTVGRERKKLEQERKAEIARRVREYTDTMSLLKKRGARRPARKAGEPTEAVPIAAAPSFTPLQIFAEGDSWFDYPIPFHGDVIARLEDLVGVPILNLAKAGDEVRYMLGTEERRILTEQFTAGCPAGGPWDAMLFSGGGNDIVGNPLALWLREFDPSRPPGEQIDQPRFDAALTLVRAGYEDLIRLRDDLSPDTHLFFHAYDFAIPDGRGVCSHGPWLKPSLDLRGVPDLPAGTAIVKELLLQFARMLEELTLAHPRKVSFVNTQNTLPAVKGSWHNELHPSKRGFKDVAQVFHRSLKVTFPARVL